VHHNNILLYKSQQDAHVTEFILSDNCSTCFGCYHHPSSGAQTTVTIAYGNHYTVLLSAAILEELELIWVCCGHTWGTVACWFSFDHRLEKTEELVCCGDLLHVDTFQVCMIFTVIVSHGVACGFAYWKFVVCVVVESLQHSFSYRDFAFKKTAVYMGRPSPQNS
jgi:hypothetical protein